jgi:hypothetical protein
MKNRIDQLFKEKLEHHAQPAPAEAWSKIETALPKKNSIIIWWRLAAVLFLFGLLVSALYWLQSNDKTNTQPVLTEKKIDLPQVVEKKDLPIDRVEASREKNSMASNSKTNPVAYKTEIEKKQLVEDKIVEAPEALPEKTEVIAEFILQPVQETVPVAKVEKPIVLEFTLAPIEAYVVAQAEEKNTGLKKLWATAKDLKNGESTFDLQEFKENLFAHNTKKDKTKNNQQ